MEHIIAPAARPERAAPASAPYKALFFAALLLLAALAGLCGWLAAERQTVLVRTGELVRQSGTLEERLSELEALALSREEALAQAEDRLAQTQAELDQARDAISLLEEYSLAAPDGTAPEYTGLFPDFYAPDWEGEAVTGERVCFLTFDDGPSANTDRVLDILDRYGVKATFFVVGKTGEADQARMREIVDRGHAVGMHSWSHDYKKVYASVEAFLEEFDQLYQWIHEVTGVYPSVYRFPGGSINGYNRGVYQEIIAEMTRRGFAYYDWNASAQDATVRPRPAADIAADCLKGVGREPAVVLAHDSAARSTTVDALPAVIEGYQNAGYAFSALHPGVEQVTFGYPKPR